MCLFSSTVSFTLQQLHALFPAHGRGSQGQRGRNSPEVPSLGGAASSWGPSPLPASAVRLPAKPDSLSQPPPKITLTTALEIVTMGSPLRLGCQVRGRHAADLRQSPAGLAASPSHPTLERPCPLPGLWLWDPPSWHLGLTAPRPKLPLPAQTSPLAPAPVEGPSVPTALGKDSLPKTSHQLQPTAVDRRVHSLPQGPSQAQSHTRTTSGLPTWAFISPDLSGYPPPSKPIGP